MMQLNYNVTGTQRKEMVEVISSVVRVQPVYKFMPTCAYAISNITVDKSGVMTWDKRTDDTTIKAVKAALAKAGFKPVTAKTESAKQPVKTAAAAITPTKTSKTVNADKAAKAPAKKAEEQKAEKPRQGYAGKTSWGADWTFNPANNLFTVASEKAGKDVRLSNIGDIFSDDLPLTSAQRKEVYALMDGSQKFAALMKETDNALLQIRNRIENFGTEQFRLSSEGEQHKLATKMAAKVEMLRCELSSL